MTGQISQQKPADPSGGAQCQSTTSALQMPTAMTGAPHAMNAQHQQQLAYQQAM